MTRPCCFMLNRTSSYFISIFQLYRSTALPGLCLHLHLRRDPSLTLPCLWAAHLLEESKATATSRKALSKLWSSRQLAANVMFQGPPLFKLFLRFLSRTIVTSHQDWSNHVKSTTFNNANVPLGKPIGRELGTRRRWLVALKVVL